jgi:hypothetical protein
MTMRRWILQAVTNLPHMAHRPTHYHNCTIAARQALLVGEALPGLPERHRKRTIACVDDPGVPTAWFESLDAVQELLRHIDVMLRDVTGRMSREHLARQIKGGILAEMRKVLMDMESVIEKVDDEMRRGREVDSISKSCF